MLNNQMVIGDNFNQNVHHKRKPPVGRHSAPKIFICLNICAGQLGWPQKIEVLTPIFPVPSTITETKKNQQIM